MDAESQMDDLKFTPSTESEAFYQALQIEQDDVARAELLYQIAKAEFNKQTEVSIGCSRTALELILQQPQAEQSYQVRMLELYNVLTGGYMLLHRYQEAFSTVLKGVALLGENETILHAKLLSKLGSIYASMGDNADGFEYLFKGLTIAQKLADSSVIDLITSDLAVHYGSIGNHEKAIEYYEKLLRSYRMQDKPSRLMVFTNNLCVEYYRFGEYKKAVDVGEEAIRIVKTMDSEQTNVIEIMGFAHNNVGNALVDLENYEKAESYFLIALSTFPKMGGNKLGELYSWRGLGQLFLRQGKYGEAIKNFHSALEYAEELNSKQEILSCLDCLASVYEQVNDAKNALNYFKRYHALYTAVFSQESEDKIRRLEVLHRTETAEREAQLLQDENDRLEKRVVERTQALEESLAREHDLAKRLKKALAKEAELSRLKSQIITTVSHEFRSPLTVIQTSTELLIKHFQRYSPEKRQQIYQRIHDSIFYLTDLLQDMSLVDTTNRDVLRVRLETMPFNALCQKLSMALFEEAGSPDNLHFHFDTDETPVSIDYRKLRQTIFNLITNALKYTPMHEPIDILLQLEQSEIIIKMEDKGVGIPAAEIERIWELFYRAANVQGHRGMGLGLYIVKKLVKVMDGTISVHSDGNGHGSQFTLTIPTNLQQAQTATQAVAD